MWRARYSSPPTPHLLWGWGSVPLYYPFGFRNRDLKAQTPAPSPRRPRRGNHPRRRFCLFSTAEGMHVESPRTPSVHDSTPPYSPQR